jgi:hypothetical protein
MNSLFRMLWGFASFFPLTQGFALGYDISHLQRFNMFFYKSQKDVKT